MTMRAFALLVPSDLELGLAPDGKTRRNTRWLGQWACRWGQWRRWESGDAVAGDDVFVLPFEVVVVGVWGGWGGVFWTGRFR